MHPTPPAAMSRKQLREFGLVTGLMFVLLFGLVIPVFIYWRTGAWHWIIWPWYVAGGLGLWALLAPASLVYLYRPWMKVAEALGWVNTRVIMGLMFYLIFLPVGLLMRLLGHDPMRKHFDPQCSSYRITRPARDARHMERPF